MKKATALCRAAALLAALSFLICCFGCARVDYHTVRLFAMGSACTLTLEGTAGEDGDATPALAPLLARTEALLSHAVPDSAIARLNGAGSVTADDRLLAALRLCEELKAKTDGRFSLSVLPITSLWNFNAEHPAPPSEDAITAALAASRDSALFFDGDTVSRTGGTLDLGAVGKGYACDVLADALRERAETGLIAVGGSFAAVGTKAGRAWRIGVRDPFSESPTATLGTLLLSDACVSTSGSYEKTFTYEGVAYHHILDPKTGRPAESDLLSVTVVCESGALSDALSTACFLVGADEAFSLAAEYGALLVAVKTDGTLLVSESLREDFSPARGWEAVYR